MKSLPLCYGSSMIWDGPFFEFAHSFTFAFDFDCIFIVAAGIDNETEKTKEGK